MVPNLVKGLNDASDEIKSVDARLLFINDSPEDENLSTELQRNLNELTSGIEFTTLVNKENMGFIGSCNRGLKIALAEKADVLLLNSDAVLTMGALREIVAVSRLDTMTGFVSPRSNNATICNSPYPDRFRKLGPEEARAAHFEIAQCLPRVSYVPTAVGFCLFIRWLMLAEFGLLDEVYGKGYNEENDFIMRCNRRGYRSVMSNWSFVYHLGSASFTDTDMSPCSREVANREILLERFPEYVIATDRFFSSVEFKTQYLVAGLVKDASGRHKILFECSHMGTFYNGSFELVAKIIGQFADRHGFRYECLISCSGESYRFHRLDALRGVGYVGTIDSAIASGPYMAVIRLAQPFGLGELAQLAPLAPITSFLMLDTIAMDCQNLDGQNLRVVWDWMLKVTSLVTYISEFSREQFRSRFTIPPNTSEAVILLSTDVADYRSKGSPEYAHSTSVPSESYILVVGNHYSHKHVLETVALLRTVFEDHLIVILGVKINELKHIQSYQAGELPVELVDRLYDEARVVLFPSHYEGFGLPIMHALGRHKSVVARNLPVYQEIKSRTSAGANIHLAETTAAMINFVQAELVWVPDFETLSTQHQSWGDAADALEKGIVDARQRFRYSDLYDRVQSAEACKALLR